MLKLYSYHFLVAALLIFISSCQQPGCTDPIACNYDPNATQDDGTCDYSCLGNSCVNGYIIKQGTITANETWDASCMYRLVGPVVVENGVTLTIMPGAVIKADSLVGSLASLLVIEKGAKIIANGTASQPIIFTSIQDNIQLGQQAGTNLNASNNSLWGGLIIMGEAPVHSWSGTSGHIEGLQPSWCNVNYGGNNPNDDSGSLSFVSIRHGGTLIGAGNEINGLTLAGVGNGTTISNVEIVNCMDDGIEIFGGTVNVSNIISGLNGDDCIDIDQGYTGTLNNFRVVVGQYGDEALEIDGPESQVNPNTPAIVSNGTISGSNVTDIHSDFKSLAQGSFSNIIFNGYVKFRAATDSSCSTMYPEAYMNLTNSPPSLIFNGCSRDSVVVYPVSMSSTICPVSQTVQTAAETAFPSLNATGATTTGWGWTWLAINGYL